MTLQAPCSTVTVLFIALQILGGACNICHFPKVYGERPVSSHKKRMRVKNTRRRNRHVYQYTAHMMIVLILVCGSFIKPVRLFFFFDADRDEICLSVRWGSILRLKTSLRGRGCKPRYLFFIGEKKQVMLKIRKKRGSILKSVVLTDTRIQVITGFAIPV
jgi:hypothetical protein